MTSRERHTPTSRDLRPRPTWCIPALAGSRKLSRRYSQSVRSVDHRKEPAVAGKKRPKSPAQTEKKTQAKPKRPKKTSRGK
jgi:hypothetical protein